jgi:hypothetical protein
MGFPTSPKVAARKSAENSRTSGMLPLSLERVEEFFDEISH